MRPSLWYFNQPSSKARGEGRLACPSLYLFGPALSHQLEPTMGVSRTCPDPNTQSQITLPTSPRRAPQELDYDSPTNSWRLPGPVQALSDIIPASSHCSPLRGAFIPGLLTKKLKPQTVKRALGGGRWFSLSGQGRHWGGTFPKKPRICAKRERSHVCGPCGWRGAVAAASGHGAVV